MRVLVSGFMPFGGRTLNPTSLLIHSLEQNEISYPSGMTIDQILLPVTFSESFDLLQKKINAFNPDVVISLGLAAGREGIHLETVALNKLDADIPDNQGEQPRDQKINPQGPESYLTTLPVQGIEGALKDAGFTVKQSNSAGTYVCNYLFYRLMETNQDSQRLCGFIHVPLVSEQVQDNEPCMAYPELKRALEIILHYINY